jgi:hypothetical protein
MITAEQCEAAAELLVDREELVVLIDRIKHAEAIRIEYRRATPGGEQSYERWDTSPEMKPTQDIIKLLLSAPEMRLANIDACLTKLGVSPPKSPKN